MEIKPLTKHDSEVVFDTIKDQFKQLYDFMETKGLVMPLVENGPQIWMNSIKSTLGKLSNIYVAYDNKKIIGFVTGIIRLSPAYLGNKKIGYLSHLFIESEYRRSGAGEKLSKELDLWFKEKNVDLIEVEVIVDNLNSINFFTKMQFEKDIIKLTKHAKIQ
ncbi:GNAT family N-acetyltransferase [Aureibaculum marinum]|uniref:GNAT family N-acetyltransferase n=1 Tax=Aureibaculum marinum TaxID=2487930 RepID=A0A3N4NBW5_9FLAO|nr:GNAT family N-acetyltransferase [Aureibaculum marinum]RPD91717.1 GNAT family N-acetyltransferase [Aureibaculum marinum]